MRFNASPAQEKKPRHEGGVEVSACAVCPFAERAFASTGGIRIFMI
jgi:hypothetical protein